MAELKPPEEGNHYTYERKDSGPLISIVVSPRKEREGVRAGSLRFQLSMHRSEEAWKKLFPPIEYTDVPVRLTPEESKKNEPAHELRDILESLGKWLKEQGYEE